MYEHNYLKYLNIFKSKLEFLCNVDSKMETIVQTESTIVVQTCGTSQQIADSKVMKSAKKIVENFTNLPRKNDNKPIFKALVVVTTVQNQYEDLYGFETMSNVTKKIMSLIGIAKYLLLMLRIKGEKVEVKPEAPKFIQSQETKQEVNCDPLIDEDNSKQNQDPKKRKKLKNLAERMSEEKKSEEERDSLTDTEEKVKETNTSELTGTKVRQSQRIQQKKVGIKEQDKFELLTRKNKVSIESINNNKNQEIKSEEKNNQLMNQEEVNSKKKRAQAIRRKLKNLTQIVERKKKREEKLSHLEIERKQNVKNTNESELDSNNNKKKSKKKIAVTIGQFVRRHPQVKPSPKSRKKKQKN